MNSGEAVSSVTAQMQAALDGARQQAREQLAAAWQLHISRVEDELRSRWGAHLEALLNERFIELSQKMVPGVEASVAARLKDEVEAASTIERRATIRKVSEHLNLAARRLRSAERQEEWSAAIIDAALGFCDRAAVFSVQGAMLRLERCSQPIGAWEAPLSDAPALAQAVETLEPLVAAYSPSQLSPALADALGQLAAKLYVFPVISQNRAIGVLTAEGDEVNIDPNALELVCSMASWIFEIRSAANAKKEGAGIVQINAAPAALPAPPWTDLPPEEQDLHMRAQRFARVQVAEMRLYKSESVRQGRISSDLYQRLRDDIDRGRDLFKQQFLQGPRGMTDYFHVELVKNLANNDAELLGAEYPGPLA
ncbi:MAG: hypothetical protein FJW39_17430 [Acidobacteria bacterium]|nr:hypothetical protein [Acidobacteriota bacterium]